MHTYTCTRCAPTLRLSLLTLLVLLVAAPAAAERHVSLVAGSAELFGTKTVDDVNRDRFGLGIGGSLFVELNVLKYVGVDWLGVQLGGMAMWLSAKDEPDSTSWLGLATGLRLHWSDLLLDTRDDGWFDFNYIFGASEGVRRSGLGLGVGYAFALNQSGSLRLGPMLRYIWGSDPSAATAGGVEGANVHWLMLGASFGFGGRYQTAPGDRDGDGVPDDEDLCPDVPQGSNPDPQRPGCPLPARPGDQDGDGIIDSEDACPTVHQGPHPDPQRPGCPLFDRDGDGVPDKEDHCPDLHQGPYPDPERPGCPIGDRDGDTVIDSEDACPDEPGAPSRDPKKHGCPGLVKVTTGQIEINKPVYFATNKDVILEASFPVLKAVAEAILASDWIKGVRIEGHTDSTASDAYNMDLSSRRAASVRRALIDLGVPGDRLRAQGFGESRPVESNSTPMGRAANRRVEFHIFGSTR